MDTRYGEHLFRLEIWLSRLWQAVSFYALRRASKDFEWFSTLGWPNVKGLQFVRIPADVEQILRRRRMPQKYWRGFLVEKTENTRTVFLHDLRVMRTTHSESEDSPVLESVDLLEEAGRYLRFYRDPENWELEGDHGFGGELVPEAVEMFVFAWACYRHGHRRWARKLYNQAVVMRDGRLHDEKFPWRLEKRVYRLLKKAPRRLTLREQLERDLSTACMWECVERFKERGNCRQELLDGFERLVERFPGSRHMPDAQRYITALRQMIQEDREHATSSKPLGEMSREEQIRELIFQLREQAGVQLSSLGTFDILADPRGTSSPAYQLIQLGYEAVPDLLKSFDDSRLSRSVESGREHEIANRVLTVGECAIKIVEKISGRTLTGIPESKETPRQVAEKWWRQVQEKGATQVLIEGVEAGDQDAVSQAEILLVRDPEALCVALPIGCERAVDPWYKWNLIQIAGKVPGGAMVPFLKAQMLGDNLECAVTAAWCLHESGSTEAVPTMIERWKRNSLPAGDDILEGTKEMLAFLVASADARAFTSLASDFRERPEAIRLRIVQALYDGGWLMQTANGLYKGVWSEEEVKRLSAEALSTIERLAASALEDIAEQNVTVSDGRRRMSCPRVCDYAGRLLAEQWPGKYTFNFFASKEQRDKQRSECMRVWREGSAA